MYKQWFSIVIASLVFVLAMNTTTILILLTKSPAVSTAFDFMTNPVVIKCNITTLITFSLIGICLDHFLLKMAGYITLRIKTRYGLAYMFILLGIELIFFVPFANDMFPAFVVALTCLIGLVSSFFAGFVRGWLIDHWSNGTGAQQLA